VKSGKGKKLFLSKRSGIANLPALEEKTIHLDTDQPETRRTLRGGERLWKRGKHAILEEMKKEAGKRLKNMSTVRSSSDRNKMIINKVMINDAISNFKKKKNNFALK